MRTGRASTKTLTAVGLLTMLFGALLVTAPGASAANDDHKVTICHATNSVTAPYQAVPVSYDGANGALDAHGANDHRAHVGDVFDFEADPDEAYPLPRNGDQWGDIIPPIVFGDPAQTVPGVNWDEAGQTIYFGKTGGILGVDEPACAAPVTPPTPDTFSATVVKSNNADGIGDYRDDETATAAGADVPFMVVITNTGSGVLTVDALTDNWSDPADPLDLLDLGAGELVCTTSDGEDPNTDADEFTMVVGAEIPAEGVVTCLFTLDGYSPAAGGALTNTVTLETAEEADASDTSIVRTPSVCTENCGPIIIPDPPEEIVEPANLTVTKAVTGEVPAEGWSFSFDNDQLGEFTLTDASTSTSSDVDAGTYVITETDAGDAVLSGIACTGVDDEVVDLDAGTVTVVLDEADVVECTFTNDFPEVEPAAVVNKPKPAVAPPVIAPPAAAPSAVLGAQVVRSLPRTGSGTQTLATVGAVLILFGAAITLGSRRKLAIER